jgi:hypothetical protein
VVTLYSSTDIADINYVQYLLDEAGIPYFLMDYETSGVLPHITGAMGDIKIQVDPDDYERSMQIVDENLHRHSADVNDQYVEPTEEGQTTYSKAEWSFSRSPLWLFFMLFIVIVGAGVFYYFL